MAISRDKKNTLITELAELFASAKGVACATYTGLSVESMQNLRKLARENNITIKVTKNRLVRVALGQNDKFKNANSELLKGQVVYAFSSEDEIAPARILSKFSKDHQELQLVAGFDGEGNFIDQLL